MSSPTRLNDVALLTPNGFVMEPSFIHRRQQSRHTQSGAPVASATAFFGEGNPSSSSPVVLNVNKGRARRSSATECLQVKKIKYEYDGFDISSIRLNF
jgi:hypothetical protein